MRTDNMTAMEKVRLQLTGDPNGTPHLKHEGEDVLRHIHPDDKPGITAFFKKRGDETTVLCPKCKQELGYFLHNEDAETVYRQLTAICEAEKSHHCQPG